jgi:hypothetical protein
MRPIRMSITAQSRGHPWPASQWRATRCDRRTLMGMEWLTCNSEVVWVALSTGVLVPSILAFFAWHFANAWQRREVTLRLLDELNSPEMMEARASAVALLTRLAQKNRVTDQAMLKKEHFQELVKGWLIFDQENNGKKRALEWTTDGNLAAKEAVLPFTGLECGEVEKFRQKHGFAKMLYFLGKVALMRHKGMVDEDVLFPSLAYFFLHYQVQIEAFLDACNDQMHSNDRAYQPVWFYGPRQFYRVNEELRQDGRFGGGLSWFGGSRRRSRVCNPLPNFLSDPKRSA